ncbi:MAG: HAD hydrolase family protein, partial [Candidatus Omnitrophica bacterium]|nr:HAD hydrolase family protein [Candidatus Omnitrophota bacterium]
EGPLSPQDNAYEAIKLIPKGGNIFEVISRYDDILTLEGREGYEPGDTLELIIPFLSAHAITGQDTKEISDKARLVKGTKEIVKQLRSSNWKVYIISTSYQQHAENIAKRVGLGDIMENVYCTHISFGEPTIVSLEEEIAEREMIKEAEKYICNSLHSDRLYTGEKDREIKRYLDRFYRQVQKTKIGREILQKMVVMGGIRKVRAIEDIAVRNGISLKDAVVVGDSITDYKMLGAVNSAEGLSIAFNANEYALPYGTVGLATTDMQDLWLILKAWIYGGREEVKRVVLQKEEEQTSNNKSYYHWLDGKNSEELARVLEIHRGFRKLVRGEAAKLG